MHHKISIVEMLAFSVVPVRCRSGAVDESVSDAYLGDDEAMVVDVKLTGVLWRRCLKNCMALQGRRKSVECGCTRCV